MNLLLNIKKHVMKTRKNLSITAVLAILLVSLMISFSCSESKDPGMNKSEAAPPPPPPVPDSEQVYVNVDVLPTFTGGDTTLLKTVAKNTVYPADAKANNIQGRVVIKFVVGIDGSVSDVSVLKGVNPSLDAEAIRVVSILPKFEKPALKDGKPVAVYYMIPISFTLK
jgi:periplasmic protein TonB